MIPVNGMMTVKKPLIESRSFFPICALVPLMPRRPLILYLAIHERSMGCVLGQHDEIGKKEWVIYYLSKKFINYETRYPLVEKI